MRPWHLRRTAQPVAAAVRVNPAATGPACAGSTAPSAGAPPGRRQLAFEVVIEGALGNLTMLEHGVDGGGTKPCP